MSHSASTSSTGESPSPIILKRKRSMRHRTLLPNPPNSSDEDQDTANCLILLKQGGAFPQLAPISAAQRKELCLYECKTCNKCFPSFQALGGHRASHKKPKMTTPEAELSSFVAKPLVSLSSGGEGKQRTHECSICGSEFPSGQALGGHMRRHRQTVILENNLEINKKEKRVLLLDLNLPAPNDDEPFVSVKPLAFSPAVAAAALVDCHY